MSDKKFMDRVKANQEKAFMAKPQPLVAVSVTLMNDNTVQVSRPEGETPAHLASIIDLMAMGIKIIAHKIAQQQEKSAIIAPPPGLKVQ